MIQRTDILSERTASTSFLIMHVSRKFESLDNIITNFDY